MLPCMQIRLNLSILRGYPNCRALLLCSFYSNTREGIGKGKMTRVNDQRIELITLLARRASSQNSPLSLSHGKKFGSRSESRLLIRDTAFFVLVAFCLKRFRCLHQSSQLSLFEFVSMERARDASMQHDIHLRAIVRNEVGNLRTCDMQQSLKLISASATQGKKNFDQLNRYMESDS